MKHSKEAVHSPYSFFISAAITVALAVALSGCGSVKEEFKPVVSEVNGEVVALTEEEADEICPNHFCEKNQIYSAYFGKKKPEPAPAPGPAPSPPPKPPAPGPGDYPVNTPEALDYSRGILGMDKAWAISEGSADVIVAVVDTGVEVSHPDLVRNIWENKAEKNGKPGEDDDGNGYIDDVYGWDFANNRANGIDDAGHGTHVAGIIASEKNAIGSRGVAPNVKIMALKFLGKSGSGDTRQAINAIRYATKMGAHIISNSWGGGGYSQLLDQSIQEARAKGIFVVAAAGNESNNNDESPNYPAGITGVISVGSSTNRDGLSDFSNFGQKSVQIIAPGSSIYSTYLNSTYKYLSGTSMATPQVSGAIALALSIRADLKPEKVLETLCASSKPSLRTYSQCGRMDVGKFLDGITTLFPSASTVN